jgi:Fe-S oxidoreductase
MVIWCVPEPDPSLALTVDKIDVSKLDYEDIIWICSATMKQYRDEFRKLQGFFERYQFFKRYEEEVKREKVKEKVKTYQAITDTYQPNASPVPVYSKTPKIVVNIPCIQKPQKKGETCVIH